MVLHKNAEKIISSLQLFQTLEQTFKYFSKKYGIWWISTISQLQRTYFYFKLKFPNIAKVACFNLKLFDRNDNIINEWENKKKEPTLR